jgi:hypothetical protein
MIGVVHIHKTAGTTLASVLKRSYGMRHCDVLKTESSPDHLTPLEFHRLLDRWYPRLDSALGHALRVYADLDSVIGDVEWVTFLRDPIVRTASHYQYDVQRGGVDLPFEEWITHAAVPDRQTRTIAGPDGGAERAIDLLGRFSFVGRADRLDESLVMMQQRLGVPDIRYKSKWVAPSDDLKAKLLGDPASVELLRSVNRHDLAVWDHFVNEGSEAAGCVRTRSGGRCRGLPKTQRSHDPCAPVCQRPLPGLRAQVAVRLPEVGPQGDRRPTGWVSHSNTRSAHRGGGSLSEPPSSPERRSSFPRPRSAP